MTRLRLTLPFQAICFRGWAHSYQARCRRFIRGKRFGCVDIEKTFSIPAQA
jgi:hypothetical protein